jgi:predicted PolB exonuclease-like 3'-5' exonuclease
MNLIAFALCSMPNVAAARRLYDVDGIDDAAVAKILFHRRKQQAGSEQLRPDQQRIALVSLVYGEPEQPRLLTLSAANEDESSILRHLGETLGGTARLAGWRLNSELAILRLRAAALGVSIPRLWNEEHVDLADSWGGEAPLDEAARMMGLPGLAASQALDVWDAWRSGDHDRVQACAELRALNTWQLAHKLAVAQGRLTPAHAKGGIQALVKKLADSDSAHLRDYAAALED